MSFDIDQLVEKIESLYQLPEENNISNVPDNIRSHEWLHVAKEFLSSAEIIEREAPQNWRSTVQNTGHAIECLFKSCLLSRGVKPPFGHDLIELYRAISNQGFQLEEAQIAMIVHLNHHYYRDLDTNTKYKARYPTSNSERLGGVVPEVYRYNEVLESLIRQMAEGG